MPAYPVMYEPEPALQRNRLTVFFRVLLWLPHYVTIVVYGIGAAFAVIYAWFAIVFTGRYPAGAYAFVARVVRYMARQNAYALLQVDKYPPFDLGEHPEYPARVVLPEAKDRYSRAKTAFRLIVGIPVMIIYYALSIVAEVIAVVVWLVAVITGRTPPGLHNVLNLGLAYYVRAMAYFLLLTEDWPPVTPDELPAPREPAGDLGPGFEPPRAEPPAVEPPAS